MTGDPGELLDKYNAGLCSDEEKIIVESWYLKLGSPEAKGIDTESALRTKKIVWSSLTANQPAVKTGRFRYWTAAAALLIIGAAGFFYLNQTKTQPLAVQHSKSKDIAPGGNKAFLTLADGRKISLTDAASGEIVKQEGLTINKTADGKLVYKVADVKENTTEATLFNTIETPKGGQYQVNLPDGTKVWLNSESSLHYPTKFNGDSRRVELKGEGYFEVAKAVIKAHGGSNKGKKVKVPFIVKTENQEVEVLGTHFNINSYKDDEYIKTTLLEGSVRVSLARLYKNNCSKLLKPGEQSQLNETHIKVKPVDTEAIIAWKNGDFIFKEDGLKNIMKQLARWYDVEVIYKADVDNLRFGGYISRSKNISAVLKIMESTGKVHFTVEGKKITVHRKYKNK